MGQIIVESIHRCDGVGHVCVGTYRHDGLEENGSVTLYWNYENGEFEANRYFWETGEVNLHGWKEVSKFSSYYSRILQTLANLTHAEVTTSAPLTFMYEQ